LLAEDLGFPVPLGAEGEMLPLTASAGWKMATERLGPLGGWKEDLLRLCFQIMALDMSHSSAKDIAFGRARDKNRHSPPPGQPHAPEDQLLYLQFQEIAYLG
jgi:hypothetical protein